VDFGGLGMRSFLLAGLLVSFVGLPTVAVSQQKPSPLKQPQPKRCEIKDLPSLIQASDPTFIRLLLGQFVRECGDQVNLARSAIEKAIENPKFGRSPSSVVLEQLQDRTFGAARSPYSVQIKDRTDSGRLATVAQSLAGSGGLNLPPIAATITSGAQSISQIRTERLSEGLKASLNIAGASKDLAETVMKIAQSDQSVSWNFASASPETIKNKIEAAALKNNKDAIAILARTSYKAANSFDNFVGAKIDILGTEVEISIIIDDIRSGKANFPQTQKVITSALNNKFDEKKLASAIEAMHVLIGDCKGPECLVLQEDGKGEGNAILARLNGWLSNRSDAALNAIAKGLEAKRIEVDKAIKAKLTDGMPPGDLRRASLAFFEKPNSVAATELFRAAVSSAIKENGLDKNASALLEAIACSEALIAPKVGCKKEDLTLERLSKLIPPLLPEGSIERGLVESVLRGKTPNGDDLRLPQEAVLAEVSKSFAQPADAFAKAFPKSPVASEKIMAGLSAVTQLSIVGASADGAARIVEAQKDALEKIDENIEKSRGQLRELQETLSKLPELAKAQFVERGLMDLNRQVGALRGQLVLGVTEVQSIQARIFAVDATFDDRLDALRQLKNTDVIRNLPPEVEKQLSGAVDVATKANDTWKALTAAYNTRDAGSVLGAVSAVAALTGDNNLKQNVEMVSSAFQLYSAATTIFAMSNPAGMAVAGLGLLSGGSGGLFGGGGGGLFGGGGSSGPDPAIMAELRAIQAKLAVIDKKLDRVLELQVETLRRLDRLATQISRNQSDVMQTLFEVRNLQEQTLERINFYGAAWTRNCTAISAALDGVSAYDIAHPAAWGVLRANVDNVVACVGGMQAFIQNVRDGKTYAARLLASILPSAIDACRAQVNGADNPCDRYKDWSVFAYENTLSLARELGLLMTPDRDVASKDEQAETAPAVPAEVVKADMKLRLPEEKEYQAAISANDVARRFRQFLWGLSDPSTDVRALTARVSRYTEATKADIWPLEPFTDLCGNLPADLAANVRLAARWPQSGDNLDPLSIMANPIAADWIADHVRLIVQYHSLLNLRPYLRNDDYDLDLSEQEPRKAGVWSLLCHARIGTQIAIAQQAMISGDLILPELHRAIIRPRGSSLLSAPYEKDNEFLANRRAVIFKVFQSNRLLARNFVAYAMLREFDRFSDKQAETCRDLDKHLIRPGMRCLTETPRQANAIEVAKRAPTFYKSDPSHKCGDGLFGRLDPANERCAMTRLLPKLRGEPYLLADRGQDELGLKPASAEPLLRYVVRPFAIREMIGTRPTCRMEPGQSWYFVWPREMKAEKVQASYRHAARGEAVRRDGDTRPPEKPEDPETVTKVANWDVKFREVVSKACENPIGAVVADPKSNSWSVDVIDGDEVFIAPVPGILELSSGVLKHPPVLASLLKLDHKIVGLQQTMRDLTARGATKEQAGARRLFIYATLAAISDAPALAAATDAGKPNGKYRKPNTGKKGKRR